MGGGNAQKSAAARLKNLKEAGKTDEQRKEASAKARADAGAFTCKICRGGFMINVQPPTLYLHVTAKHPTVKDPFDCFDSLKDYDPSDPKGLKKIAAAAACAPVKKKKKEKKAESLDDMLSAGLTKGKKKKK